jgi:hypothetical protein
MRRAKSPKRNYFVAFKKITFQTGNGGSVITRF